MINFSNYYCLVVLLILRINACKGNNSNTTDLEITFVDVSGSSDDVSGSDLKFDPDVCELPIDEGDCRNESLGTNEDSYSADVINDLYKLNDLNQLIDLNELKEFNESNERNELNESNESSTLYYGYNKNKQKCEQFNYDGCGGNVNRFDTVNECRNTCYTPLKNFLAKVSDLLVFKFTNSTPELPAT